MLLVLKNIKIYNRTLFLSLDQSRMTLRRGGLYLRAVKEPFTPVIEFNLPKKGRRNGDLSLDFAWISCSHGNGACYSGCFLQEGGGEAKKAAAKKAEAEAKKAPEPT